MQTQMSTTGAIALSHLGVIRAHGADAVGFLQGQLTGDVAALGPHEARLAGFCSAKGRLQASFIVWKAADDEVLLVCSAGLLAQTVKRLSMFVLRAKCRITDASAELPLVGLVGDALQVVAADTHAREGDVHSPEAPGVWERRETAHGTVIRLADAQATRRAIVIGGVTAAAGESSVAHAANKQPAAAAWATIPTLAPDLWKWLDVESGIPTIESATVDRFVPQMINFELLGGVDFKKGCYPGQEVVARSQYRGTIKRRMFLFDVDDAAEPGQEVFHDADPGQPSGQLVNAAARPGGGSSALVEIKLAALEGGTLHLGAPDGPALRRRPLPYNVPAA